MTFAATLQSRRHREAGPFGTAPMTRTGYDARKQIAVTVLEFPWISTQKPRRTRQPSCREDVVANSMGPVLFHWEAGGRNAALPSCPRRL
jgi:hypothetical protein